MSSFPVSKNSLEPIDKLSKFNKLIPGTFYFRVSTVFIIFGVKTLKLSLESSATEFLISLFLSSRMNFL